MFGGEEEKGVGFKPAHHMGRGSFVFVLLKIFCIGWRVGSLPLWIAQSVLL